MMRQEILGVQEEKALQLSSEAHKGSSSV